MAGAVCFLFAAPAQADPIAYTITWTLFPVDVPYTHAPPPTAYTYDPDTALFGGFVVLWEGHEIPVAAWINGLEYENESRRRAMQASLLSNSDNEWYARWDWLGYITLDLYGVFLDFGVSNGPPETITAHGMYTVTAADAGRAPIAPVPEPATLTLCGIGIAGVLITRGRRRGREI